MISKSMKKRNYGAKKQFWTSYYSKMELRVLYHLPLLVPLGWESTYFYIQYCHSTSDKAVLLKLFLDDIMEFQTKGMN